MASEPSKKQPKSENNPKYRENLKEQLADQTKNMDLEHEPGTTERENMVKRLNELVQKQSVCEVNVKKKREDIMVLETELKKIREELMVAEAKLKRKREEWMAAEATIQMISTVVEPYFFNAEV